VKFVRRSRGLVLTLLLVLLAEVGLSVAKHSLELKELSPAVTAAMFVLGLVGYLVLKTILHRARKPETLEIGRRGLLITQPEAVPFALAWRMIREADLVNGRSQQQWRFALKNGGQTVLTEGDFSREQWKRVSTELERKLRARNIPVRVVQSANG
jgi:hypothetical protein